MGDFFIFFFLNIPVDFFIYQCPKAVLSVHPDVYLVLSLFNYIYKRIPYKIKIIRAYNGVLHIFWRLIFKEKNSHHICAYIRIYHIKTSKRSLARPISNLGSIHREVYLSVQLRSGWRLHATIKNLLTGQCDPEYLAVFQIFLSTKLIILIVFKMSFIIINYCWIMDIKYNIYVFIQPLFFWNGW